jgi:hypothetical protein
MRKFTNFKSALQQLTSRLKVIALLGCGNDISNFFHFLLAATIGHELPLVDAEDLISCS